MHHHRWGPRGASVTGDSDRNAARRVIRKAEVVDERSVVESAVRGEGQDRIAASLNVLEQTLPVGRRIPAGEEHVRERFAAIGAGVDERPEAIAIVIRRRHDVRRIGRVDDDVLLVLRLVALCSISKREGRVPHDRVGIGSRNRRVQRRRREWRAPAQREKHQAVCIRVAGGGRLKVVGEEQRIVSPLGLVGTECLEVVQRLCGLGARTEGDRC